MKNSIVFKTIRFDVNQGLGIARRKGMDECSHELVAIMDSDDICLSTRFAVQLRTMREHPECDVIGSLTYEFIHDDPSQVIGIKKMPRDDADIKNFMKRRCPFNHQSVMMKKTSVLRAGGYLSWHYNEDYYLWIRMALDGCRFYNIQEPLVFFRVSDGLYDRRGGKAYYVSERDIQRLMRDKLLISRARCRYNVFIRFLFQRLFPPFLRSFVYKMSRSRIAEKVDVDKTLSKPAEQSLSSPPFSLLTNVYGRDDPKYVAAMLDSIINQTLLPSEIVIVIDGPISRELEMVIADYGSRFGKMEI